MPLAVFENCINSLLSSLLLGDIGNLSGLASRREGEENGRKKTKGSVGGKGRNRMLVVIVQVLLWGLFAVHPGPTKPAVHAVREGTFVGPNFSVRVTRQRSPEGPPFYFVARVIPQKGTGGSPYEFTSEQRPTIHILKSHGKTGYVYLQSHESVASSEVLAISGNKIRCLWKAESRYSIRTRTSHGAFFIYVRRPSHELFSPRDRTSPMAEEVFQFRRGVVSEKMPRSSGTGS